MIEIEALARVDIEGRAFANFKGMNAVSLRHPSPFIDFEMNVQEAGDAPRMVHRGSSQPTGQVMTDGGEVVLESGYSEEVVRELMRRGHQVGRANGIFGGYQGILRDSNGVYYGASESRKDGHAAGY